MQHVITGSVSHWENIPANHYWGHRCKAHCWGCNSCLYYGLTLNSNPLLQHHFWSLGIASCLDCIIGFEVFNTYNKEMLGCIFFSLCTFPTSIKKELSDIWFFKPAVAIYLRAHYTWWRSACPTQISGVILCDSLIQFVFKIISGLHWLWNLWPQRVKWMGRWGDELKSLT